MRMTTLEPDEHYQTSISLKPSVLQRAWSVFVTALSIVFQISVIIAVFTFFQRQEPKIERNIDHETKVLEIGRAGYAPLALNVYAVSFDLPLRKDDRGHIFLDPAVPIQSVGTHGKVGGAELWYPTSKLIIDLRRSPLKFSADEPLGSSPMTVYCLVIEARNLLSNQSVVETVLTQNSLFPVSMFGPIGSKGSMGGGYNATFFGVERLINSECRSLYEKIRH
jgi:hypothetical protein